MASRVVASAGLTRDSHRKTGLQDGVVEDGWRKGRVGRGGGRQGAGDGVEDRMIEDGGPDDREMGTGRGGRRKGDGGWEGRRRG